MFDHVTIRVADFAASEAFYDSVLPVVGAEKYAGGEGFAEWGDYSIVTASDEIPATRRLQVAFSVPEHAGSRSDGEWLLDPDGNSIAVAHGGVKERGAIDHVVLRVADVSAALGFYETIAPFSGFTLANDERPELVRFRAASGASFSLVRGTPSEHVHVAFPAASHDVVDAFHRAATGAGYRNNGGPGERPVYHEGYYGAFVLDPDGTNVELVDHGR